jgi:uncharacterized MAPEG superfamily protein
MTVPQWALLGFAVWTLFVLLGTIGVYRWARILTGRVPIAEWRVDLPQGSEWYRRAIRAHMNCVENLPVFAAIVLCVTAAGAEGALVDWLALAVIAARVCQTSVHLSVPQTNAIASVRFGFFLVQVLCMLGLAVIAVCSAVR